MEAVAAAVEVAVANSVGAGLRWPQIPEEIVNIQYREIR